MKKPLCAVLVSALLLGSFAGCGGKNESSKAKKASVSYTVPADSPASVSVPAELDGNTVSKIECEGKNCKNLKELVVEGSSSISEKSFQECPELESVVFKDNVTYIGKSAFSDCPKLKTVVFEGDAGEIGSHAFRDCPALETVTIKGNATQIEEWSFYKCPSLESFSVKDITKWLNYRAFQKCPKLSEIVLPDSSEIENSYNRGIAVGTKAFTDQFREMKVKELSEKTHGVLGKDFEGSLEIDPESASKFRDELNLLLFTDTCPKCDPTEYDASQVPEDSSVITEDFDFIKKSYPGTLVTDEKINAVKNGNSPIIYALVEAAGETKVEYIGATNHRISYRVSFWNAESDQLLGWFFLKSIGDAPGSYQTDDNISFCLSSASEFDCYLRDENGNALTPLFIIEKYVYGVEKGVEREIYE